MNSRTQAQTSRRFCTFRLGESLYGIDLLDVKEVHLVTCCTAIPHTPLEVLGYVNLRGQVQLVLDLRRLLDMESKDPGPNSRLVLFKPIVGEALGVLVDEVGDVIEMPSDQIEKRKKDDLALPTIDLVAGVGKLAGELLTILDARRLLPAVERSLSASLLIRNSTASGENES